jgi:Flp pilus assembly pilin Flp
MRGRAILRRRSAQSLVEYALILAIVAIVVVGVLRNLGVEVRKTTEFVGNEIGLAGVPIEEDDGAVGGSR